MQRVRNEGQGPHVILERAVRSRCVTLCLAAHVKHASARACLAACPSMEDATPAASGPALPVLVARLTHIRGMLGVLQTVKQTKKQARPRSASFGKAGNSAAARLTPPRAPLSSRR